MNTYTFSDLQKRYDLPKAGLYKFINRHIDKINQNGKHATKTGNKWLFDKTAVSILDKLRNFGQAALYDPSHNNLIEIILNMQTEITRLNNRLEDMQIKLSQLETTSPQNPSPEITKKHKIKRKKKNLKG